MKNRELKFTIRTILVIFFLILFNNINLTAQTWYWENLYPKSSINSIGIAPNGKIYIIGMMESSVYGTYGVSTDNGLTWKITPTPVNNNTLTDILFNKKGDIFINCFHDSLGIIIRSTNEGVKWDTVYKGARIVSITIAQDGKIYSGNRAGDILLSNDNGINWLTKWKTGSYISSILVTSKGIVYAGTGSGLIYSQDAGQNWDKVEFFKNSIYATPWYVTKYDHLIFKDYNGVYLSSDLGKSWATTKLERFNFIIELSDGRLITGNDQKAIVYDSTGNVFFQAGNFQYIRGMACKDSLIFIVDQRGLFGYDPRRIPYIGNNYLPLAVGNKWQYIYSSLTGIFNRYYYKMYSYGIIADTFINNNKYFKFDNYKPGWFRYSETDKKIYIWDNGNDNLFMDFTLNAGSVIRQYNSTSKLFEEVTITTGNDIFFDTLRNYKSYNRSSGGTSSYTNGIAEDFAENLGVALLRDISKNSDGVGVLVEAIIKDGEIIKKFTKNRQPEIIIQPLNSSGDSVFNQSLTVNHRYSYFYSGGGVYDSEINFIDTVLLNGYYSKSGQQVNIPVQGATRKALSAEYIFNFQLDMKLLTSGYSFNYKIYAKDKGIMPTEKYSPDTGYYKLDYKPLGVSSDKNKDTILQTELGNCFPNPVNSTTTFSYKIPVETHVYISIYNTLGQKVKELVNNNVPAGIHSVKLNCDDLSSGIYFCSMRAGKFRSDKKFIVLK